MKNDYFECDCESPEHVIRMSRIEDQGFDDFIYVSFFLRPWTFWRRVRYAIMYVFGYKSKYGDFGECIWCLGTMKKFRDYCDKVIKENEKIKKTTT